MTINSSIEGTKNYFDQRNDLDRIAKAMKEPTPRLWVVNDVLQVPYISPRGIYIPHLFLIKTEDIPQKFQVGPDSEEAYDPKFLLDFANWTREFTLAEKCTQPLSYLEQTSLRIFLRYIQDPVASENAKEFVLAHEMAHSYYKHGKVRREESLMGKIDWNHSTTKFAIPAGLALASLSFWYAPFITATLALGSLALLGHYVFNNDLPLSIACEGQADALAAAQSLKSTEGGKYLFRCFLDQGLEERKRSTSAKILYDKQGNFRFNFTHPKDKERFDEFTEREKAYSHTRQDPQTK